MSVQAISAVLAMTGVAPSSKMVLLAIANYADHELKCWPSVARLASDSGISARHVSRIIAAFESQGVLKREERKRDDGAQSSNMLRLSFPPSDILSPPPDMGVTPPLTPVSPLEPSIEPLGNISEATPPHPDHDPGGADVETIKPERSSPVRQADIDRIWAEAPKMARERSSKADVGKALRAAVGRGATVDQISAAVLRYHGSPQAVKEECRAMRGLHRSIQEDRWKDWAVQIIPIENAGEPMTQEQFAEWRRKLNG